MKPMHKIILITTCVCTLNFAMGFDLRFTVINITWLLPIAFDIKRKNI